MTTDPSRYVNQGPTDGLDLIDWPVDTVIDVGAHVGNYAAAALAHGARRVFAVEPDPDNYSVLCRGIVEHGLWGTIVPLPLALHDKGRECLSLHVPLAGNTGQRSMLYRPEITRGRIFVTTISLTTLMMLTGPCDLLKVDIEGGEWAIFSAEAAPGQLDALRSVRAVYLEVHNLANPHFFDSPSFDWDARVHDVIVLMERSGLRLTYDGVGDMAGVLFFKRDEP